MSEQKYINNKNENLEPAWRDRLLLESLVGQILPTLIIAEPEKVDEILEFCRQVARTIKEERNKVGQPKRENTRRYLAHLRSL